MDQTNTAMSTPWMWTWLIILLLFLFLLWNNGFGWFWWNNNAAAFMAGAASQQPNGFTDQLIQNNTMWQNQLFNQQSISNLTNQVSNWFCGVNQNIEKAILQAQQNACNIMQNCTANTQKVLDMICQNQITDLRASLAEARLEANNAVQTATLINTLRPYPVPTTTTTGS